MVDNLTYNYQYANYSNKLRSIDESAGGGTSPGATENILADFKDGTNGTADDYDYDANGNTLNDRNKNINPSAGGGGITYNYLNLPTLLKVEGKGEISYVYDATGERLQKITQPLSSSSSIYTYAGPFTYKDDELQFIYTEEGRLRPVTLNGITTFVYDFFIKDHLGNIRMILTDEVRTDPYPNVSFEDGTVPDNPDYYDREEIGITARPQSFGDNNTNGLNVQLLRKNAQSLGVSKLLKVMVKDKINVQVDYYFPTQTVDNSGANGINSLITILSSLLNSANAPPLIKGNGVPVTTQLNNNGELNTLLSPQNASSGGTSPKAYLNIIFFDEQFKYINQSSRIIPVATADSRQQIIQAGIEVPKNGYVNVYVSNESNNLVYFDNFKISHTRGPILEEDHYYPFGGKMTGICSHALPGVQNSLGFQSKELDEEFDLDLYDFEARNYDPQIGRFLQLDPKDQFASGYVGMGNSWINGTDPDGQFFWLIAGALIGGFLNGMHSANQGGSFLGGFAKGSIVGAVGGALSLIGTPATFLGNIAWGAAEGVATNELSNLLNGNPFLSGAGNAALWGAAFAVASSDNTRNFFRGQGFRSNNEVLQRFVNAGNYKGSLKYFKMDADVEGGLQRYGQNYEGAFDPKSGRIKLSESAFKFENNASFDKLNYIYQKEAWHQARFSKLSQYYDFGDNYPAIYAHPVAAEDALGHAFVQKNAGAFPGVYKVAPNAAEKGFRNFMSRSSDFSRHYFRVWENQGIKSFIYKIPRRFRNIIPYVPRVY